MGTEFSNNICRGYILKGDLIGAIRYIRQFPEQAGLYDRCMDLFEREHYITYDLDADLNEIMTIYQRYYRDVFYLRTGKEAAADLLRKRLAGHFHIHGESVGLDDMEQAQLPQAFQSKGLHFLGGLTNGYYGPYIWRTTETKTYEVELPDGIQAYTVKLLDGFISRSWIDFLSFGQNGTGGWADDDGTINCVKSAYDFDSEDFRVSLLKHEAQHARDLTRYPDMSSADLEYRAKLVELIYSNERNLLERFVQDADGSDQSNGHAVAASRIVEGFARSLRLGYAEIPQLPRAQVQAAARKLLEESDRQLQNSKGGSTV